MKALERMSQNNSYQATQQAVFRALANDPGLEIANASGPASVQDGKVRVNFHQMPTITRMQIALGEADSLAFKLRYHQESVALKQRPSNEDAARVLEVLEQTRIEYLGTRYLLGARKNIASALEADCLRKGLHRQTEPDENNFADALRFIVREQMLNEKPPDSAALIVEAWRKTILPKVQEHIAGLRAKAEDQKKWSKLACDLLKDLSIDVGDNDTSYSNEDNNDGDDHSNETSDNQVREEDNLDPSDEQSDEGNSEIDGDDSGDSSNEENAHMEDDSYKDTDDIVANDDAGEGIRPEYEDNIVAVETYKAWTKEFDRQVDAHEMVDNYQELVELRQQLDRYMDHLQNFAAKLAARLQRKLLALQQRSWLFDLEEGILDTSKLARIIISPSSSLSYKMERETEFRDTVICLLIDNSGSMRGRPINTAAVSADILSKTLERCGVKSEVLGFTTNRWKGGLSREQWLKNGEPSKPGRLNDLLHLIYKSADEPYRSSKIKFGLMLREGLLKENIDGEAVEWAFQRLLSRPEERKILMVISDGAPVDDSTLSVNENNYLDKHLRDVIAKVENNPKVQLMAIGIGHDVKRYYHNAVTIMDVENLAETMITKLGDMFDEDKIKQVEQKRAS